MGERQWRESRQGAILGGHSGTSYIRPRGTANHQDRDSLGRGLCRGVFSRSGHLTIDSLKLRAFGDRLIGPGLPCLVVAEIGINHNGSRQKALELCDAACEAGADAVKFQAGDPERYVNRGAWDTPRQLQDGRVVPYIEYRKSMELSDEDFRAIAFHCKGLGLPWFVSPLDAHSVERFERFDLPAYKVASPKLTDSLLLQRLRGTGKTVILSTGMSDWQQIDLAADHFPESRLVILHAVSAYPCPDPDTNIRAIRALRERFGNVPIGYSGHETGIWPTLAAVTLGATVVERHFTLDRSSWGSDQAASLEPSGFSMLIKGIRSIENALQGDGSKALRDNELANHAKFRAA